MNARLEQVVCDTGAEEAVLSACLVDCSVLETIRDYVSAGDFWTDEHRKIFAGFVELDEQTGRFDVVSLTGWLRDKGLDKRITSTKVFDLLNAPAIPLSHTTTHAKRVRALAQQRRVADAARTIAAEGATMLDRPVSDYCQEAEAKISIAIESGNARDLPESIGDIAERVRNDLDERGARPIGKPCGLRTLDHMLQGWESGTYVIAGRPGMGKTALAKAICKGHARANRQLAVFVSCEMPKDQLAQRMICAEAKVPLNALRTGKVTPEQKAMIVGAVAELNRIPMVLTHRPGATVAEVRAVVRRSLREQRRRFGDDLQLGMIAVDYIQIMSGKGANREGEISSISRGLMQLAGEFGVPVLVLSQLNRGVEQRPDKRPNMSDLRESGAIEQDAYVILFPYRDEYYNPETEAKGLVEVGIAKNRNGGPGGKAMLAFQGKYVLFENRNTPDQDNYDFLNGLYD
jgi:replicative DNA helicase